MRSSPLSPRRCVPRAVAASVPPVVRALMALFHGPLGGCRRALAPCLQSAVIIRKGLDAFILDAKAHILAVRAASCTHARAFPPTRRLRACATVSPFACLPETPNAVARALTASGVLHASGAGAARVPVVCAGRPCGSPAKDCAPECRGRTAVQSRGLAPGCCYYYVGCLCSQQSACDACCS